MVDPREFASRIEFKSWTSVFRMFATAEKKGVPHNLVITVTPTFELLQVMAAFHATLRWLLSCWNLSAELVTAYRKENFEEVNSDDKNVRKIDGNERNIREVNGNNDNNEERNSNEKNIIAVNGNNENTRKVNGDDGNIWKVNNQRANFTKETCKAYHFEDERRNNFVGNTCNDENIKKVNTYEGKTEGVNQRITFRTAEQEYNHDGRKITQQNLNFKHDKDPQYPSDNV